jgi:hypothetical protein
MTAQGSLFRGQFRPKGSRRWQTFCERPTEGPVWDELLIAPELRGLDLRVRRIDRRPVTPDRQGATVRPATRPGARG